MYLTRFAAALTVVSLLMAGKVTAQTASHPRLRIVVRGEGGQGIVGIVVEVWRVEVDESVTEVTAASTGPHGILDFDVSAWPTAPYAFIFASGSSGYAVETKEYQEKSYTPFGIMLNKTGDEWAMYLLHPDGRIEPDISYDLNARPRPPNYLAPTPRPESWTQVLTKRGLPVELPPPFPNNTPTAVAATQAKGNGSNGAGVGATATPAPQSGDSLLTWTVIVIVGIAYLLWRLRKGKRGIKS